jgi:aspartate carbamoyltransferase catalytic subunit
MAEKMNIGELCMVAPALWQPHTHHYGRISSSLTDGLHDADVIICLRVQQERLSAAEHLDLTSFRQGYTLTPARLALAKPDTLVMHPGPINRGIEIDDAVADGEQSVILDQVKNGVFMRMAILESIIASR